MSAPIDVLAFRNAAFHPEQPLVLRVNRPGQEDTVRIARSDHSVFPVSLPAISSWFETAEKVDGADLAWTSLGSRLSSHLDVELPFELILSRDTSHIYGTSENPVSFIGWLSRSDEVVLARGVAAQLESFIDVVAKDRTSETYLFRFEAPLRLLTAGLRYNTSVGASQRVGQLYIAQAPLNDLPTSMQRDVPVPELVQQAGRGDVYNSSIWLGLEPTYTPWHRDPNPNLFCQLHSSKVVRLLPPAPGHDIFQQVKAGLVRSGSSRIRGAEMMQGPERRAFMDAIWGDSAPDSILEVVVEAGDALFIPKGWWHSIRSRSAAGALNASANWWFR